MNEEQIFHEVLTQSPAERAAYLDRACAGEPALRASIEALLRANEGASQFLGHPAQVVTVESPSHAEGPGTVIGPYKLLEQIGEGGFGVVFMAEQTQPIRRKVALKILKPGMDTRQVVARFEAERQALALMDHPNIAKVFDGGATDTGRPYFVMELVKGVPITEYSDVNQLTPGQRLELFIAVCQAVQHAHQKGIIHRDLKPSNVLVSRHDTTPTVKVIDFGVVKALGQTLTDKTLFTGITQMIGTPLYMSPEQAGMSDLDVDTRSDIYSLGVLLYELLTGTTPFDKDRFKTAAYDEIRRIIREEEPPKPSTRLLESKDSLPSISAQRHMEPAKLTNLVRGELDWIVMKALEKDRSRRYETVNGFAMDVQRYLADEPVLACPPSAGYRLRKYTRKYKKVLIATGAFATLLLVATAISIGLASWALQERNRAEQQKHAAEASFKKALEAVDQMLTRVGEVQLAHIPQMELVRRELLQDALRFYQEFLRERGESPTVRLEAASAYKRVGDIQVLLGEKRDEGERAYGHAVALLEKLLDESPADPSLLNELAEIHNSLGMLYLTINRWPQAVEALQQAEVILGRQSPETPMPLKNRFTLAKVHNSQVVIYRQTGDYDKAVTAFINCRTILEEHLAGDPKDSKSTVLLAHCHNNAGLVYGAKNSVREAETVYQKAVDLFQRLIRDEPEELKHKNGLAKTLNNLGILYTKAGQHDKAEAPYQQSHVLKKAIFEAHPNVVEYKVDLAGSYSNLGAHIRRIRSAEESLEWTAQAIQIGESVLKQDSRYTRARMLMFDALMGRGYAFVRLKRPEDAAKDWRRMIEISEGQTDIRMRLYRPFAIVFLGEHAQATAEIETLMAEGHVQGDNFIMFAEVHSLGSAAAAEDARLIPTERVKQTEKYGNRAVELLRKAHAAGYFKDSDRVTRLKEIKNLKAISLRPDYRDLIAELEKQSEKKPKPE